MSSSAGVAYWARIPPFWRTAIWSPILIASSMSWVTKTIVLRSSACRRRNSFCSRSRLIGSIAPNGSSISISGGSAASARATPTRWRWPPESWRVAVAHLAGVQAETGRAARRRARGCAACPSRAAWGRWRCSRRPSGAGTGRSAGSRSRSRAAARPVAGRARSCRRSGCRRSVMSIIRLTIRIAVVLPQPGRADEHADLARGHGQRELVDRGLLGAGVVLDDLRARRGGRRSWTGWFPRAPAGRWFAGQAVSRW